MIDDRADFINKVMSDRLAPPDKGVSTCITRPAINATASLDLCARVEFVLQNSGLIDWNEPDWVVRRLAEQIVRECFQESRPNSGPSR